MTDRTLVDALYRHLSTRPDAPAYRGAGGKVLTFADVEQATNRIAKRAGRDAGGTGRSSRLPDQAPRRMPAADAGGLQGRCGLHASQLGG